MISQELLLTSTVQESICSNLTFEEANSLRIALNLSNLNCRISINDPDQHILFLDGVNSETFLAYQLIQKIGSVLALKRAAKQGSKNMVQILLANGAKIDAAAKNFPGEYFEFPALIEAAMANQPEIVSILLENGADVNKRTKNDITVLMWAVESLNPEIVQMILDRVVDVNEHDQENDTALSWAVGNDSVEIVRMLIDRGANVNTLSSDGDTPLIEATRLGNSKMINLLKSAGAQ